MTWLGWINSSNPLLWTWRLKGVNTARPGKWYPFLVLELGLLLAQFAVRSLFKCTGVFIVYTLSFKNWVLHTHTPLRVFSLCDFSLLPKLPLMATSFGFSKCNCSGPTTFGCIQREKGSSICWLSSAQCDGTLYKFSLPSQRPLDHYHSADFTGEAIDVWSDYMTCQGLPSCKWPHWALNPDHCGFKPGRVHPVEVRSEAYCNWAGSVVSEEFWCRSQLHLSPSLIQPSPQIQVSFPGNNYAGKNALQTCKGNSN